MDGYLIVRKLGRQEKIHKTKVTNATCNKVEKVMSGMLRNMGEDYYIDDTEFDILYTGGNNGKEEV